jgi:hypothetical protein
VGKSSGETIVRNVLSRVYKIVSPINKKACLGEDTAHARESDAIGTRGSIPVGISAVSSVARLDESYWFLLLTEEFRVPTHEHFPDFFTINSTFIGASSCRRLISIVPPCIPASLQPLVSEFEGRIGVGNGIGHLLRMEKLLLYLLGLLRRLSAMDSLVLN